MLTTAMSGGKSENQTRGSPEPGARGLPWSSSAHAALVLLALLAAGAAGIAFFGSPSDGGPVVSLELTPPARDGASAGPRKSAFATTRAVGGNVVADSALIEDSLDGALPMIAADGRTPMKVYSQGSAKDDGRPKIAIVMTALGVGTSATEAALKALPPVVTLAFVPFASDLQTYIDSARTNGHEVLLQVPMEPVDFPDSDPGPHALLAGASTEENLKRLNWAMSRATGFVGISNLLGARFLGEMNAIEPVLAETAKRGLLFFDDGASSRSLSGTAARHVNAAIATGTLSLDSVQSQAAIDNALVQLEAQAKRDGVAIGVAMPFPVSVARIAEWAASSQTRGFALVPITAVAVKPQAQSAAR